MKQESRVLFIDGVEVCHRHAGRYIYFSAWIQDSLAVTPMREIRVEACTVDWDLPEREVISMDDLNFLAGRCNL